MKHINKILLLFIFILTFISCNFSVKNNETKKLYIVDYRIYKFQTDKNFIGAVTFLYSNDEDTVRYLMNHQKRCNIINSNYKRKNICTNYKFIAPNKKKPNLFIIREVFCEENGFNNYTRKQLDTLTLYIVLATIIGARLGHCLFYDFPYYSTHPLDILKVYEGGLASHGGGIGIIVGMWLYCRKTKESWLWLFGLRA